jgi:hypothetical protein
VIAAYARMERALERHGLPRRHSEAPLQYMLRALSGLNAGAGALRRLTELYHWARFSPHPVGEDMRRQALDALTAIRADLQPGAVPAPQVPLAT